ncbi:MAG: FAD-dependent oxidoreductase [Solirubrobacteraceae bacterium]|jgi:sulfide:quinone oxidoreductase
MTRSTPPHLRSSTSDPFHVVVAGGGVAALEASLALRALAGDRIRLTLLSAAPDFVYRPMAVLQPFVQRPPRHLPLVKFAAGVHAEIEHEQLASVDVDRRSLRTAAGHEFSYDALLLAIGAGAQPPVADVPLIDAAHMNQSLRQLIYDIDRGAVSSLVLIVPRPSWPLPVYEVSLLLAERARRRGVELAITIVTAEPAPAAVFGEPVSTAVAGLLTGAGIVAILGAGARSVHGALIVDPGGQRLDADRIFALPQLRGPAIGGLPSDGDGFLPITAHCEVVGAERVFAAGDATTFPVKFGSIAAQQADAAAEAIAALAGAEVTPEPYAGVVHGMLLGSIEHSRLYFSAEIRDGAAVASHAGDTPTAEPDAKIAARYLAPYLDALWADGPRWLADQLSWETTLRILEAQTPA